MAVRMNLMLIRDLQQDLKSAAARLRNIRQFESHQCINEEERRQVAEENRKLNILIEEYEKEIQTLERENHFWIILYTILLLVIFIVWNGQEAMDVASHIFYYVTALAEEEEVEVKVYEGQS